MSVQQSKALISILLALIVVAGLGGYFAGSLTPPATTITHATTTTETITTVATATATYTKTVVSTSISPSTRTLTETVTTTRTATETITSTTTITATSVMYYDTKPPEIKNLEWTPTKVINDKIYDINVTFEAQDDKTPISYAELRFIPIKYGYFITNYGMRPEDYDKVFPPENERVFVLTPVDGKFDSLKEEFSVPIKDIIGGREYRITAIVKDAAGNANSFEVKTPYMRQYENFGKTLYESGLIISASFMPWNFRYTPMPPDGDVPMFGRYDASDPIIQWKAIDLAQGHGINLFYVDGGLWEPFKTRERGIIKGLADRGMKVAILWGGHWNEFFRVGGDGLPEWAVDLSDPYNLGKFLELWRNLLSDDIFLHQNYHKVDGKIVVFIWDENALVNRNEAYVRLREVSKQTTGEDLFIIADCLPRIPRTNIDEYLSFWNKLKGYNWWDSVDALTSWIGFYEPSIGIELSAEERIEYYLQYYEQSLKVWRNFSEIHGRYFVPTVVPGFDNSYSWGGPQIPLPRSIERFTKALELAMEHSSEGYKEIRIDTWNDWGEWSYVEPSVKDGLSYLNSILEFLRRPPFYRIRLNITTTSDWTSIRLTDGVNVLVSGITEVRGGFQYKNGKYGITLIQDIASALRGEEIGIAFDCAITNLSDKIEFEITRGGLGRTIVEVWNINKKPIKVAEVVWSGSSEPSDVNPFKFTVSSGLIKENGPVIFGIAEITEAEFYLSRKLDKDIPNLTLNFYRVRINFTTTSDHAALQISNAEMLNVRVLNALGGPSVAKIISKGFSLNQPLEQAKSGFRIGLVADIIIEIAESERLLNITVLKGDLNEATVEIFNYNTEVPLLIKRATHKGVSSPENTANAFTLSIDIGDVKAGGPVKVQNLTLDKLVWAFYYPWYRKSDWTSPYLKDRPLTPYDSSDVNIIERHIQQAMSAGIDGFVVSWWGPNDFTDKNLVIILDVARKYSFKIIVYFETLIDPGRPRSEEQIIEWLEYLISKYGQHPAYYRLNDKPVIMIFASDSVPLSTWNRVFNTLRSRGFEAMYIGMGQNLETLSVFDGLHIYGVGGIFRLGTLYQRLSKQVKTYSSLIPGSTPKIWVATIQPGYDERLLPNREGLYWDRRDGVAYRYTFEVAVKSNPDWLVITSWNEWWENTHVEPSTNYDDLYLKITKELVTMWRSG